MKRRNFIKSLLPIGLFGGGIINLNAFPNSPVENVIIINGSPTGRFEKGIEELGGISRFVKKGDRVVIKPTMAFDNPPESGFNSNPELIQEIIQQCLDTGAKIVSVFDHTIDSWTKCYKNSGIERIAKDALARVLPANDERFYSEVKPEKEGILRSLKIHNSVLEADVIINVASARIENQGQFRGGIKNLTGFVWGRSFFENPDNEDDLAVLANYLNPSLNVVDGKGFQVISANCFAADILASETLNLDPGHFVYLKEEFFKGENLNNAKKIIL
ncbi:MAG: DUF362 domain-containing protein [Prolixibacteraceae bacterium]|nr:DUF362 domain-containing protein [Prolixibacteraceae bacterium]